MKKHKKNFFISCVLVLSIVFNMVLPVGAVGTQESIVNATVSDQTESSEQNEENIVSNPNSAPAGEDSAERKKSSSDSEDLALPANAEEVQPQRSGEEEPIQPAGGEEISKDVTDILKDLDAKILQEGKGPNDPINPE